MSRRGGIPVPLAAVAPVPLAAAATALLAAAATVLLAAPQRPATAPRMERSTWSTVSCASGELTGEATARRQVRVTGWIQPCAGAEVPSGARFAVLYYGPSYVMPNRLRHYADPAGPTTFAGGLNLKFIGLPHAVCLAYSPSGRVSCLAIDRTDDQETTVTPIPTDDPRVDFAVLVEPLGEAIPWPYCGTCV
jgi:hypothetical protein